MSSFKRLSHTVRGEGRGAARERGHHLLEANSPFWPWGVGSPEALTFHSVLFEKEEKEKHSGKEEAGQPHQGPALVNV